MSVGNLSKSTRLNIKTGGLLRHLKWNQLIREGLLEICLITIREYCLNHNPSGPGCDDAKLHRCGVREVNDSIVQKGAAIIDLYHYGSIIIQISNTDKTGQRQLFVCCCHLEHVVAFAAGCQIAMEFLSIP